MKKNSFFKKRLIHIYVIISMVVIILITAGLFMLKYSVEGEKNLPFNLKTINIISTAESDIKQDEEENWHAGIMQKNDVFIVIEKNANYKKINTIKNITIENFQITKNNDNEINLYRPTDNNLYYKYEDDYKIGESLTIAGEQETKLGELKINNQGGTIGFSITQNNLGEYNFSVNEKVPSDGKLLAKAGMKEEDISFEISFDLIIETGDLNKFKTNICLKLPVGNILEEGVSKLEDDNTEELVFKRVK